MRARLLYTILPTLAALFFLPGCEQMKDAFNQAMMEEVVSEDPNSDNYKPRYVVGIFSIVKYPRAGNLEKEIQAMDGKTVWINTNQNFSSKNFRDAKVISRPGDPDLCDLQLRTTRQGKMLWDLLAGNYRDEAVAFVVDGIYFGSFVPEPSVDSNDWVTLRVGIDPVTAKGIARFAAKNYLHYNPDAKSWF